MYDAQATTMVNQLLAAGMPESQAQILLNMFANCSLPLSHAGSVDLSGSLNMQEGSVVNNLAGSTINNYGDTNNAGDTINKSTSNTTYETGATHDFTNATVVGSGAGYPSNPSGPTVLYATEEGSETAQSDTWTSGVATTGVTVPVTTRVVYNESGDKKLYGFYRTFVWNNYGQLYSISAETRYTIDTAGPC